MCVVFLFSLLLLLFEFNLRQGGGKESGQMKKGK